MLGFIFIVIMFLVVILVQVVVKAFLLNGFKNKKGSAETAPPKIYYVKNSVKRKSNKTPKPTIAIKGRIIEKEK